MNDDTENSLPMLKSIPKLLIDDDEHDFELLKVRLDHEVGRESRLRYARNFEDAESVLEKQNDQPTQIVFLDLDLGPKSEDGFEVIQEIRKSSPRAVVVAYTNMPADNIERDGASLTSKDLLKFGFDGYFQKGNIHQKSISAELLNLVLERIGKIWDELHAMTGGFRLVTIGSSSFNHDVLSTSDIREQARMVRAILDVDRIDSHDEKVVFHFDRSVGHISSSFLEEFVDQTLKNRDTADIRTKVAFAGSWTTVQKCQAALERPLKPKLVR